MLSSDCASLGICKVLTVDTFGFSTCRSVSLLSPNGEEGRDEGDVPRVRTLRPAPLWKRPAERLNLFKRRDAAVISSRRKSTHIAAFPSHPRVTPP
jgi:hypothetical protein